MRPNPKRNQATALLLKAESGRHWDEADGEHDEASVEQFAAVMGARRKDAAVLTGHSLDAPQPGDSDKKK